MFLLKALIKPFFLPPTLILILCGTGLIFVLLRKRKKLGKCLLLGGMVLYYLLSIQPVSDFLISPLENKYPPLNVAKITDLGYVVILASPAIQEEYSDLNILTTSSSERLMEAIRLYFVLEEPSLLFSGGGGNPFLKPTFTKPLTTFLSAVGVKLSKVCYEIESRDTFENALNTKDIIGEQRFLLVTSAYHMPRAMDIFKKLNMEPVPAPCDYQGKQRFTPLSFLPNAENFVKSTRTINEYLGIVWYRIRGRL
ncbi:hypothetical protein ES703_106655 [subsurface metagenome]